MGNINNFYICNNSEKKQEEKLQINLLNSLWRQKYNQKLNSNNDLEKNLKKIRQKVAIKKILNYYKKYKSNNKILTPIHKYNNDNLIINTCSYSDLFSNLKTKNVSKFVVNKNDDILSNVIEFDTSTSSLHLYKNKFTQNLYKFLKNNNKYISYYKDKGDDFQKQQKLKGIFKKYIKDNSFYIGEFLNNNFHGYGFFIRTI